MKEFSPKKLGEHSDRKEKLGVGTDPAVPFYIKAAGSNDAMDVRMKNRAGASTCEARQ